MRHKPQSDRLMAEAELLASKYVEATGDLISLSNAVYRTVLDWFKRHENMPEDAGE